MSENKDIQEINFIRNELNKWLMNRWPAIFKYDQEVLTQETKLEVKDILIDFLKPQLKEMLEFYLKEEISKFIEKKSKELEKKFEDKLGDIKRSHEYLINEINLYHEMQSSFKGYLSLIKSSCINLSNLIQELPSSSLTSHKNIHDILDLSINELSLSMRTSNVLSQMNIKTIGEVYALKPNEILGQRNFGKYSYNELKEELQKFGLKWGN